jgi:hypothetical protein
MTGTVASKTSVELSVKTNRKRYRYKIKNMYR